MLVVRDVVSAIVALSLVLIPAAARAQAGWPVPVEDPLLGSMIEEAFSKNLDVAAAQEEAHAAGEVLLLAVALAAPPTTAVPSDGETLDLEALVAEAVQKHPEARAARNTAAAAREVGSRMASLPDPVFGLQLQNIRVDEPALDTSPMTAIQVGLTEAVPFPGKLGRRGAVADARAEVLGQQATVIDTSVALGVRRAYWNLHFAERALDITTSSERVINGLVDAAIARVSVGKAPQQDALQAQVTHSLLRTRLQERREALVSSQRALNASVGRAPTAGLPSTAAPSAVTLADRARLMEQARANNASLRVAQARVETARKALSEARYDRWPDLQLGVGYRIRSEVMGDPSRGADMVGATLGVTLPVFASRKQNARVREMSFDLQAAEAAHEATALAVTTALERALDAVARLDEEISLYQTELLPETGKALDASAVDYEYGRVGFVSVLQNWQAQLAASLSNEALVREREHRLAEVTSLIEPETRR